jgi:hypothetical protein
MILDPSRPDDRQYPFYGVSICATISLGCSNIQKSEQIKTMLANKEIYLRLKPEFSAFADAKIIEWFDRPPHRTYQIDAPPVMWDNDDDTFVESELTPLRVVGLEFDIRMPDEHYETLVAMIDSDEYCAGCESILKIAILHELLNMNLVEPVSVTTEVSEFGGG